MISKVNINTNQNINKQNSPAFKGGIVDMGVNALQWVSTEPMYGVALIDGVTAIAPRTIVDAKTNGFAAAETFRRESSGLIVNCMIPGLFVLGTGKIAQMLYKDFKVPGLLGTWANEESLTELHQRYKKAGNVDNFVDGIFKDLKINVGKDWKPLDTSSKNIADAKNIVKDIINESKDKKELKKAIGLILEDVKGAEHIKLNDKQFGSSLSFFLRDTVDTGKIFKKLNKEQFETFLKKAVKFTNAKSLAGLATIIPLAASVQSINRWITRKTSGQEGAPIYKDFIQQDKKKKAHDKQKAGFFTEKLACAALMVGVAILSLKERPNLKSIFSGKEKLSETPFFKSLQFHNIFPSMDQCRWIATATFASRMFASEDKNELREATFRDIATFCSLYFFGDYVNKGVGSLIKKITKGKVDLMNYASEKPKSDSLKDKFNYWVKETRLKSFAEAEKMSPAAKKYRALCEVSSLGFSMLLLGILVPWYVRKQTEIKHRKELEANFNRYHTYPTIFPTNTAKRAFQAFGMMETANK